MKININKNNNDSSHFAGVDIRPGETYIDAVARAVPARQRVLMGLSLKIMSLRLKEEMYGKYVDGNAETDAINEFDRLKNMTDEEYDLEVLKSNNT